LEIKLTALSSLIYLLKLGVWLTHKLGQLGVYF